MFNFFFGNTQHQNTLSHNFKEGDKVGFRSSCKFYGKIGTYIGRHTDTAAKIKLHPGCGERIVYASYDSLVHRQCIEQKLCKFKPGDRVSFHKYCKYTAYEGIFEGMDDIFAKVKLYDGQDSLVYIDPELLEEPKESVYFTIDGDDKVYLNYGVLKLPVPIDMSSVQLIQENGIKYLKCQSKRYFIKNE